MRALLSHPLYVLGRPLGRPSAVLCLLCLCILVAPGADAQIPQSIGPISDYGAVLDRHGRERIAERIEETKVRFGISVYLLADWANPYPSPAEYANAVYAAWGLSDRHQALLVVFLRSEGVWTHAAVGFDGPVGSDLATRMREGIADLVAHRRIEEAMDAVFDIAASRLEPIAASPESNDVPARPTGWITGGIVLFAGLLIWGIHRRVCPRCGRLLRVRRGAGTGRNEPSHRVYYCRSCGYERSSQPSQR